MQSKLEKKKPPDKTVLSANKEKEDKKEQFKKVGVLNEDGDMTIDFFKNKAKKEV